MIFVADLLDTRRGIELEATAVIPAHSALRSPGRRSPDFEAVQAGFAVQRVAIKRFAIEAAARRR